MRIHYDSPQEYKVFSADFQDVGLSSGAYWDKYAHNLLNEESSDWSLDLDSELSLEYSPPVRA